MENENLNEEVKTETLPEGEAPVNAETPSATSEIAPEVKTEVKVEEKIEEKEVEPQVIIQKERGFAHYVGFALLSVLCIVFFFIPGIAITYGVSCLVDLNAAAVWIFSSILSAVIFFMFKLKIKGFKKAFYFYIALCVLVFAILIAVHILTDLSILTEIGKILIGSNA